MLNWPFVIDLPCDSNLDLESKYPPHIFCLKTCQRQLVLDISPCSGSWQQVAVPHAREVLTGSSAYQYLLEVLCGLKSRFVGEHEILGQFKRAFLNYQNSPTHNPFLKQILSKALQDTKKIRTEFLKEFGHRSYASYTRKLFYQEIQDLHQKDSHPTSLLVLGSGQLAGDLLGQFAGKVPCYMSARNEKKVQELTQKFSVNPVDWGRWSAYQNFPYIMNTIGTDEILFSHDFFRERSEKLGKRQGLFIDLGKPSCIDTHFGHEEKVFRLKHIFNYSDELDQKKCILLKQAREKIYQLSVERYQKLMFVLPFGEWQYQATEESLTKYS